MDSSLPNVSNISTTETKTNPMAVGSNLFNAAVRGRIKPFKKRRRYLTQIVNESRDTILHVHISKSFSSSTEFVKKILRMCPFLLLQVNDKNNTPLHLAAIWGKSHFVEVLLECARSYIHTTILLNSKNSDGKTAFDVAMECSNINVVKTLIKEGEPNFLDFANNIGKLLNLAAKSGDLEILDQIQNSKGGSKTLLEELKKYDDSGTSSSKDTILHIYIKSLDQRKFSRFDGKLYPHVLESTDHQFVRKILKIYSSLLLKANDEGNTPLHVAAQCNKKVIVEALFKHVREDQSLDPESTVAEMLSKKNSNEKTAFYLAVDNGSIEVVNILIKEAKNDVFDFAKSISKILDLAAERGYHEILDSVLIHEKGQEALDRELSKYDNTGTSPKDTILHIYIKSLDQRKFPKFEGRVYQQVFESTDHQFVKKILKICPSLLLNANDEGNTPLHVAIQCNEKAIVEVLFEHVREDQSQDPERTVAEMLNKENNNEKTTFDLAVDNGNIAVVNILIKEAKTDVFDFAKSISKILDLAAERGYHEILDSVSIHEKGKEALDRELSKYDNPGNQDTILHNHIKSPWRESTDFVKKILKLCPSLRLKLNAKGDSPIHVAAECNKSETAEVLLTCVREHSEDGDSESIKSMQRKQTG